jgi:PEP-CTERM motif
LKHAFAKVGNLSMLFVGQILAKHQGFPPADKNSMPCKSVCHMRNQTIFTIPARNLGLSAALRQFNNTYDGRLGLAFLLTCFSISITTSARAQSETLTEGNSSVTLNMTDPGAGMNSWTVDGQNQLSDQWFYYRIGSSGTAASVGSLTLSSFSQPTSSSLNTTYTSSQFSLQVVYSLVGGASGSGTADLSEQIKIQNLTSAPLAFNFFQYANFQLGGPTMAGNQVVQLETNRKGLYNEALVTLGNSSPSENVDIAISPGANNGETGLAPNTLNSITGTPGYNLNNMTNAGPGNTGWGLQWTNSIAANGTMLISEDLNTSGVTNITAAPEPATWALIMLGLVACLSSRHIRANPCPSAPSFRSRRSELNRR